MKEESGFGELIFMYLFHVSIGPISHKGSFSIEFGDNGVSVPVVFQYFHFLLQNIMMQRVGSIKIQAVKIVNIQ